MRPLLRVTGQQFLVLQVLLMENRMCKMLLIPGAIFCAHFQGVKDMDSVPGTWILSGIGVIRSE